MTEKLLHRTLLNTTNKNKHWILVLTCIVYTSLHVRAVSVGNRHVSVCNRLTVYASNEIGLGEPARPCSLAMACLSMEDETTLPLVPTIFEFSPTGRRETIRITEDLHVTYIGTL